MIDSLSKKLVRKLTKEDIPMIVDTFAKTNWPKSPSLFEQYLKEQSNGERIVWLAFAESAETSIEPEKILEPDWLLSPSLHDDSFAGYVTLKWNSLYQPFRELNIPEIMDLNVLPQFRELGAGSYLMQVAEQEVASRADLVGIGVGLYRGVEGGYGSAHRFYVIRGYIPDGKGVTYNYEPTIPGNTYPLDDDLRLWFTKQLKEDSLNNSYEPN